MDDDAWPCLLPEGDGPGLPDPEDVAFAESLFAFEPDETGAPSPQHGPAAAVVGTASGGLLPQYGSAAPAAGTGGLPPQQHGPTAAAIEMGGGGLPRQQHDPAAAAIEMGGGGLPRQQHDPAAAAMGAGVLQAQRDPGAAAVVGTGRGVHLGFAAPVVGMGGGRPPQQHGPSAAAMGTGGGGLPLQQHGPAVAPVVPGEEGRLQQLFSPAAAAVGARGGFPQELHHLGSASTAGAAGFQGTLGAGRQLPWSIVPAGAQDDANVPREPYSETAVIKMASCNEWYELEAYLRKYVPQGHGKDVILEHAGLFIHCRQGQLLNILNDPSQCEETPLEFVCEHITPLGTSNSDLVNHQQLAGKIQSIMNRLSRRQSLSNDGAIIAITDYMRFYAPEAAIGLQQRKNVSLGWRFMFRLKGEETTKGVLVARCMLCQRRMPKKKNILDVVTKHIGDSQCDNLTRHAVGVYQSFVKQEKQMRQQQQHKIDLKGKAKDRLDENNDSDSRKVQRTQIAPEAANNLKDINQHIDEVMYLVNELCLISNSDIASDVQKKINAALGSIKISANQLAETTRREEFETDGNLVTNPSGRMESNFSFHVSQGNEEWPHLPSTVYSAPSQYPVHESSGMNSRQRHLEYCSGMNFEMASSSAMLGPRQTDQLIDEQPPPVFPGLVSNEGQQQSPQGFVPKTAQDNEAISGPSNPSASVDGESFL